jgi:hypothetical protein
MQLCPQRLRVCHALSVVEQARSAHQPQVSKSHAEVRRADDAYALLQDDVWRNFVVDEAHAQ